MYKRQPKDKSNSKPDKRILFLKAKLILYCTGETSVIIDAPKKAASGSNAVPDLATLFLFSSKKTIISCFNEPILYPANIEGIFNLISSRSCSPIVDRSLGLVISLEISKFDSPLAII